jgi:hypothetical protein
MTGGIGVEWLELSDDDGLALTARESDASLIDTLCSLVPTVTVSKLRRVYGPVTVWSFSFLLEVGTRAYAGTIFLTIGR